MAREIVGAAHHEESETVQIGGRWVNVYGKRTPQAGRPLPKKYPYEKDTYDTVQDAVRAAERRSEDEGKAGHGDGESATSGRTGLTGRRRRLNPDEP